MNFAKEIALFNSAVYMHTHLFSVVYNHTEPQVYMNGELIIQVQSAKFKSGSPGETHFPLKIGKSLGSGASLDLDEVYMFFRAFDAEEVKQHYDGY